METKYEAMDLSLFDGAAAAGAGGEGTGANGAAGGTLVGAQAAGEEQGKPEGGNASTGRKESNADDMPSADERRKAFRELVSGEYRDIYTEETQRMIDKRFKETRTLQERLDKQQGLMDRLAQRYNVPDGDPDKLGEALDNDNAYWDQKAEEMGMSVEQAKEFEQLRRSNDALRREEATRQENRRVEAQAQKWYRESLEVKKIFSKFDLGAELKDPDFLAMLRAGTPMEHAYKVRHFDELMQDAMATTRAETEKQVADSVRARGNRPAENGATNQSGFAAKSDIHKLTKADREDIARRAARGERIVF